MLKKKQNKKNFKLNACLIFHLFNDLHSLHSKCYLCFLILYKSLVPSYLIINTTGKHKQFNQRLCQKIRCAVDPEKCDS